MQSQGECITRVGFGTQARVVASQIERHRVLRRGPMPGRPDRFPRFTLFLGLMEISSRPPAGRAQTRNRNWASRHAECHRLSGSPKKNPGRRELRDLSTRGPYLRQQGLWWCSNGESLLQATESVHVPLDHFAAAVLDAVLLGHQVAQLGRSVDRAVEAVTRQFEAPVPGRLGLLAPPCFAAGLSVKPLGV